MIPSPRMRRALSVLGSVSNGGSLQQAADAAGVSTETLLRWFDQPRFRDQLRSLTEQESDSARAEVWRALLDKCRAGDSSAIRLYFDLKDRGHDQNSTASSPVVIIDDIPAGSPEKNP